MAMPIVSSSERLVRRLKKRASPEWHRGHDEGHEIEDDLMAAAERIEYLEAKLGAEQ